MNSPLDIDTPPVAELMADRAWWQLYQCAFPSCEREPAHVITATVEAGAGLALRARVGERTIGLATIHLLRGVGTVFLVYLAVSDEARSSGIGTRLFEEAWRVGAKRLRDDGITPRGMVWEIDPPPAVCDGSANDDQRQSRLRFFQRPGGGPICTTYQQPPVDGNSTVPMVLMYRPADGITPNGDGVNALIESLYFEKYAPFNGIDPALLRELLKT